jgi:RNA polymerase sigma factor (sigma-70 family)
LTRIFRSRGFTDEEADEFAQETIARVLVHLDKHGRRSDDLNPLFNTIAKNLIVERFRTGGREVPVAMDERLVGLVADPADEVTTRERRRHVHAAISELPERQRRAMLMSLEGLSPAEIARVLSIKRNAADAILHRARRHLAMRLRDCRDSVWGAGSFVWFRVRMAVRRAADWVRFSEACGALGPAVAGLSALVVFAIQPGNNPGPAEVDPGGPAKAVLHSTRASGVHVPMADPSSGVRGVSARRDTGDAPPDGVRVDLEHQRVSVITTAKDPTTGETGPLGIEIYREDKGPHDEPYTGPILDRSFELICSDELHLCGGG